MPRLASTSSSSSRERRRPGGGAGGDRPVPRGAGPPPGPRQLEVVEVPSTTRSSSAWPGACRCPPSHSATPRGSSAREPRRLDGDDCRGGRPRRGGWRRLRDRPGSRGGRPSVDVRRLRRRAARRDDGPRSAGRRCGGRAGGRDRRIVDGRGVAAALALGADGAQLGTRFLLAREAATAPGYRAALLHAVETDTVVTTNFTGRPARSIRNRFVEEMAGSSRSLAPAARGRKRPLPRCTRARRVRPAPVARRTGTSRPPRRSACCGDRRRGRATGRGSSRALASAFSFLLIGTPSSSAGRSGPAHSSHSTAKTELKGALHAGQRWRVAPPHAGQRSGSSGSNSSNQRWAAPQPRHTAAQSPSTLRRSSRSQSAALPMPQL